MWGADWAERIELPVKSAAEPTPKLPIVR